MFGLGEEQWVLAFSQEVQWGGPPGLMGWLQKKELKLAVALRGPGQGLEARSLPGPTRGCQVQG